MENLIKFSAICNRGKVRQNNQDRIYLSDINQLKNADTGIAGKSDAEIFTAGVFDGMGGFLDGDKAAGIALEALQQNIQLDLKDLCFLINRKICEYMEKECIMNMGSTAAIIRLYGNNVEICNVGDSKVYIIRENKIMQISYDHAVTVGREIQRRVLTQHLGIPEKEMVISPYFKKGTVERGDRLLLCSDGLTDMVSEHEILKTVGNSEIELCACELYDKAMENGGLDNISVIVCEKE